MICLSYIFDSLGGVNARLKHGQARLDTGKKRQFGL